MSATVTRREPGRTRRLIDRADAVQRRRRVLGFPIGVLYKFIDDQGIFLTALLTYYGFVSLFPLLLLLASVVGFMLDDPGMQQRILDSTINQFPILRDQLSDPDGLTGSFIAVVVGLAIALYGGLGIAQATQHTMNTAWSVPRCRRPNVLLGRLRSMGLLATGGVVVLVTTVLSAIGSQPSTFNGELALWFRVPLALVTIAINSAIFVVGMRITTALRLTVAQVRTGAIINAVVWYLLQYWGARAVRSLSDADRYGAFTLVLGLIGWIFAAALSLVVCVEINVVKSKRLHPRALLAPFTDDVDLTDADRRAYAEAVDAQRLKAFVAVDINFRHDGQFRTAQRVLSEKLRASASWDGDRGDQPVEIVDRDGTVIEIVARWEAIARSLRHRTVMIAVLHPERNELLVVQRPESAELWPGHWDVAVSDIANVAEDDDHAARRVLDATVGIRFDETRIASRSGDVLFDGCGVEELVQAWVVVAPASVTIERAGRRRMGWIPLDELEVWFAENPMAPDTLAVLAPMLRALIGDGRERARFSCG